MLLYRSITGFGASMVGKAIACALVIRVLQTVGVRLASRDIARFVPMAGHPFSATLSFVAVRYVGERHVLDCMRALKDVAIE